MSDGAGHFGYDRNTLLDVLNRGWRVWGENPSRGKPLMLADVDGCCLPTTA